MILNINVSAKDFYWIGGSGNFNDISHWSDQPGGKVNPAAALPGIEDNVFFDEFSFTAPGQAVKITSVARCRNMHWKNVKFNPTLTSDDNPAHYLVLYGGVTFSSDMVLALNKPIYFRASKEGNVINFGGQKFDSDLHFENKGGWRITKPLDLKQNTIYFKQGILSIEANVTCGRILSENSASRKIFLNDSEIRLNKPNADVLKINSENCIVSPGTSEIVVISEGSTIRNIANSPLKLYDVVFEAEQGFVVSENTSQTRFNKLTFEKSGKLKGNNVFQELIFTEGYKYFIYSGGKQEIKGIFRALGKCYAYITIESENFGGDVEAVATAFEYLKVKNIRATGAAANFVAPNSYDLGGNSKWNITPPNSLDYEWTGAAGDNKWGTHGNWNKDCVPSRNNNVLLPAGSNVIIDVVAECKSITIKNTVNLSGSEELSVFGSLEAGTVNWTYNGDLTFVGNGTNNVQLDVVIPSKIKFVGNGTWKLLSDLKTTNVTEFTLGTLNLNGRKLTTGKFLSEARNPRTLRMEGATIDILNGETKAWNVSGSKFNLIDNGTSQIRLMKKSAEFYNNLLDVVDYNKVLFLATSGQVFLTNEGTGDPTFHEVRFDSDAKIKGDHQYYHLFLGASKEYLFQAGSEQKLLKNDGLVAKGTCAKYINLKGDGGVAYLFSDVSSGEIEFARIENLKVKGSVVARGGLEAKQSFGVSGYEGWKFTMTGATGRTVKWIGKVDNNWFNGANWNTGCIPTRLDDVVVDKANLQGAKEKIIRAAEAGSVAECRNMLWQNAHSLSFEGNQPLNIFGSIDLKGMRADKYAFSGDITFKSETDETVDLGAVELVNNVTFKGTEDEDGNWNAGSWTLNSDLKTSKIIRLEYGDLIIFDKEIEAKQLLSNYDAKHPRTLNISRSSLSLERLEISAFGINVIADRSFITLKNESTLLVTVGDNAIALNDIIFEKKTGNSYVEVQTDKVSFNTITCKGNTVFKATNPSKDAMTIDKIKMAVGKSYTFQGGKVFTVGSIDANGACEGSIDIGTYEDDQATLKAKTATSIVVNSVNVLNVKAIPDGKFIAKSSLDLGNNPGWVFKSTPSGKNLYWVGGTGHWDDPKHWSTTSGGTADGCVPTAKDNVFFDANSFTAPRQIVYTGSSDIRCRTMDWSGSEHHMPNFKLGAVNISGIYIYGSLLFNSSVNISLISPTDKVNKVDFYFRGNEAFEIKSYGYEFPDKVIFDGDKGSWKLVDNFTAKGDLFIELGKLNSNEKEITVNSITSLIRAKGVGSRGLNITNSKVTIKGREKTFDQSLNIALMNDGFLQGFELIADNSRIHFVEEANVTIVGSMINKSSLNELIFYKKAMLSSGDQPNIPYYEKVTFKTDAKVIGKNQFGTLQVERGSELTLASREKYQMKTFIANGSCFGPIQIHSDKAGKKSTIQSENNVDVNFVELKDISADLSKGTTYTAINSFDRGNVTGWNIDNKIASINLYWTGNAEDGKWDNYKNWSRSEDGSEEGCVPTINDDVFFTLKSFKDKKNTTVKIAEEAFCHNITWRDEINIEASFEIDAKLNIGGSLRFIENMELRMNSIFSFIGDGKAEVKEINFANRSLNGDIVFNGDNQAWIWQSGLVSTGDLYLEKGRLNANKKNFAVRKFISETKGNVEFDITESLVTITSNDEKSWNVKVDPANTFNLKSDRSQITFPDGGGIYCSLNKPIIFNDVIFENNGVVKKEGVGEGKFGSVLFNEQGKVFGNNEFKVLKFTLGYEHNTIEAEKTVTVTEQLKMEGVRCAYVFLESSEVGKIAYLKKPTGVWDNIYNAVFTNIHASSGDGLVHPVHYHLEGDNYTGFVIKDAGDKDPPSFDDKTEQEQWCQNFAVLDKVEKFPINSKTTFVWERADILAGGGAGVYTGIGKTSSTVKVTKSGWYRVTISYGGDKYHGDCNLTALFKVKLNKKSDITLDITKRNILCFGKSDAFVKVQVKKPDRPNYTFKWYDETGNVLTNTQIPDKGESSIYGLAPGKYRISVTDSKTCTEDTIINVFNAYEIKYDLKTVPLKCFNQPTGEIKIDGSGGEGTLSYFMNAKPATNHITNLTAGIYEIYLKDSRNCISKKKNANVKSNPEIEVDLNPVDLTCSGDTDGKFTPTISGGVGAHTYRWTGPTGFAPSTKKDLTGLSGGTYYLQVRDFLGCEVLKSHTIKEPKPVTTKELVIENVSCKGKGNGEIFVAGSNGVPDYRYILGGVENSTGKFKNLAPNTYHLKIIDANNCSFEKDVKIAEPSKILFFADKTKPTCKLTNDGVIFVTAEGGNGAYKYSWSGPNDFRSNSKNIEKLESGIYELTITDKKKCEGVGKVNLDIGSPIQLGLVVEDHVSKRGAKDGKLAIEIIEGTSPYTFTVKGPGINVKNPDHFDDHNYLLTKLPGGVYTVTASDSKSCNTVTKSVIINEGDDLHAYINRLSIVNCDGKSGGKLGVMCNDASATYSWVGPDGFAATTKVISNLAEGIYEVTVSNKTQKVKASYRLKGASGLTVNATFKNVTCFNEANGTADLEIDSGGDTYSVYWTGPDGFLSTARQINHLQPGTYDYRVETIRGCSKGGSVTITQPTPMNLVVTTTNISKAGLRDGKVKVNVTGGTKPYTILVTGNKEGSYPDNKNTTGKFEVLNLPMDVYEVSVFDANGCNITAVKKVHEASKMLLFVEEVTKVTCPGGNDGKIKVKVNDASADANLVFSWKGPNLYRSNKAYEITNLKAGKYTLNVVDKKGDPKYDNQTITIFVKEPAPLKVEYWKKNISCKGRKDGYINIHPLGGTPEYTYQWAGMGVKPKQEDQQKLEIGKYSVKITDAKGCISEPVTIKIEEPKVINVAVLDKKEPTCYGYEDGFIKLGISEGKAPYTVLWDNYGSVTKTIKDIEKGNYHYIVRDANGCEVGNTVLLNQPDTLIAQIVNVKDVKCHGEKTGSAEVKVKGGTPNYKISWSDAQKTKVALNLDLGEYEVEVFDAQGCRDTAKVKIFEPDPLFTDIEVLRPTTIDSKDGQIGVSVKGGVKDYDLSWLDEEKNLYSGASLANLKRGIYSLKVVDKNKCKLDTVVKLEYLYEQRIRIPKAFTPNGDGYNDYWDIERIEFVQKLKIVIYDRMGKSIFQFSGTGNEYRGTPWKGVDGSNQLPVGSYYYAVELDDEKPIIGTVTILR